MPTDQNRRFVAAVSEIAPQMRLLIPQYFNKFRGPLWDWEQEFPGVLCVTEFDGQERLDAAVEFSGQEDWWGYARTKIDGCKEKNVNTSMEIEETGANPPLYAGSIRIASVETGCNDVVAVTGGPSPWDHVLAGAGLLRSRLSQREYLDQAVFSIDAPGARKMLALNRVSEDEYNFFVTKTLVIAKN